MSRTQPGAVRSRRTPGLLALGLVVAVLVLGVVSVLSLGIGTKVVPVPDTIDALLHGGQSYAATVIASRIPRTLLGLLVGAALAAAGVLMQGVTRNPLADPGLFGVNAGAAAAIVTGTAFLGLGSVATSVWVALPGAFAAVVVVYVVGSAGGRSTPVRLVLAGVVVTAVLAAYIQAVALSFPSVFDAYRFWVIGSLAGRSPGLVLDVMPFIAAGLVLALALAGPLNALALGDDTATALGAHVGRTRLLAAVATTLLCAGSTAAVGPIAFVGLAVPHLVRGITGSDHRWLMPYCILAGPILLLVADIVARVIVSPAELMAGIVTAFIGAPLLAVTVRRMKVAG